MQLTDKLLVQGLISKDKNAMLMTETGDICLEEAILMISFIHNELDSILEIPVCSHFYFCYPLFRISCTSPDFSVIFEFFHAFITPRKHYC